MILHRTPQKQTFESIKQKYSKNSHTVSVSPITPHTPASLKENHIFSDLRFGKELSKSPIKNVSPLKLKSVNTQDQFQKEIDRIRQKFCHQEYTSKGSYYTQRGNSQRTLNKESLRTNKQTVWARPFQLQQNTPSKEYPASSLYPATRVEISKSSPIRKYLDLGEEEPQVRRSKDQAEARERLGKLREQREESSQTIRNIESIMQNIKATLCSNK